MIIRASLPQSIRGREIKFHLGDLPDSGFALVSVDLVGKERRMINAAIDSSAAGDPLHGLPHVEDLCEAIIDALLVFLTWFVLIRVMELLESEIVELTRRGIAMMEMLKEVFPEKSGEAQA